MLPPPRPPAVWSSGATMSQGMIYNIQRMSIQDGPGIRTTVFLKGCPLRCLWCSNPESQQVAPQLLVFSDLCTGCGACLAACPSGAAVRLEDGKCGKIAEKCTSCGVCAAVCPNKAREISGKIMTVDEVMEIVHRDSAFYANSGGGVTFGGGEPTMGGDFFIDLLQTAHDDALHTAVDTCGFCPEDRFEKTLKLADLLLFDCKHMDPVQHKELTGQDNALILKNLQSALLSGIEVRIRMPLMPGLNDSDENFAAMSNFLGKFGQQHVEVMPCHMFGTSKYRALNKPLPPVSQYTPDSLEKTLIRMKRHGLKYTII